MVRILWADDQIDVVRTLAESLAPLAPNIRYVADAETALSELFSMDYDLVILDLKMPPGDWGGLQLLERLGDKASVVPVLILSGEGTQHETIRALRLGATDYVTKERADSELLDRIRAILGTLPNRYLQHAIDNLPSLFAVPLKRYAGASHPCERLRTLIQYFESALRVTCLLGLSGHLAIRGEKVRIPRVALRHLSTPSMGGWNMLRSVLAKQIDSDAVYWMTNACITNPFADRVVQIRNDLAHGAEPSDVLCRESHESLEEGFSAHIMGLVRRVNFKVFVPHQLRYENGLFQVTGMEAKGDSPMFPPFSVESKVPLNTDRVYVYIPGSLGSAMVEMSPFLEVRPSKDPGGWSLLAYDGLHRVGASRQSPAREEIRYFDVWTGERNIVANLAGPADALGKMEVYE